MTYQETLDYLYSQLPMFQRIGASAYKKDLSNTVALCQALGNPQNNFKSVHVAGTNGKGSSSHAIASVLQEAGYKVGLYTSPHLKDFSERIRINGKPIPEAKVTDWVEAHKSAIEEIKPSFFELTVGMAFDYFSHEKVDIAVIEVGMGGRLDSTNIITPLVSLITKIGLDHTQFLGDTLEAIAAEKGGIIKESVPLVVGNQSKRSVVDLLWGMAVAMKSEVTDVAKFEVEPSSKPYEVNFLSPIGNTLLSVNPDIKAVYFQDNLPGILGVLEVLIKDYGFNLSNHNIKSGLEKIVVNTGLKGRYQEIGLSPKIIADVSHNPDGLEILFNQISQESFTKLHIVLGVVADKDLDVALPFFPKEAVYYFCQANIPRAMPVKELAIAATAKGLNGTVYPTVSNALQAAKAAAKFDDLILITGSTFVVAEVEEL